METKSLYEICVDLYEGAQGAGGQSAVLDYIENHHPEVKWVICEPRECLSPIELDKDSKPYCLVCGSSTDI